MEPQVYCPYSLFFLCLLIPLHSMTTAAKAALQQGFTIDLIHRDSPNSPLKDPSKTKWQLLSDTLRRSATRIHHFKQASAFTSVHSTVIPAGGEYLMNVSIGTPPLPLLGIADTGSDLTWTQCRPCLHCYEQRLPLFDPNASSTFRPVTCTSNACSSLGVSTCSRTGTCSYYYSYGDNSYTNGDLATETVTFTATTTGQGHAFPDVVIGCGHENAGSFSAKGSGLIGLAGVGLSLVSQLRSSIGGKFSYCLVPYDKTSLASKISFGSEAVVSGPGTVSTPLVKKNSNIFYYLTLESITVGDQTLEYKKKSTFETANYANEGNIIIDSGTTLTLLPAEFYADLEAALRKEINTAEEVKDPEGTLSLCYRSEAELEVPNIRVRFAGAELELKSYNAFVRAREDIVCFAMVPANGLAIFGNLAQMDYLVGYDIEEGKVFFKPKDCTKHG